MRRGERPFSTTKYARMNEVTAAKRMLTLGYCQVSRRFGYVARVDVSDEELLVRVGKLVCSGKLGLASSWYDFYRRGMSEDVITDVPESIMFMIRNPGGTYRPPGPSNEAYVEAILMLGLV